MGEYIEREGIYNALKAKYCDECTFADKECYRCAYADVMYNIDIMPAADVQPVKRGKLEERIGYGGWGDTYYHCSVCGSDWVFEEGTPKANEWNFCPHCGADMRGDENG